MFDTLYRMINDIFGDHDHAQSSRKETEFHSIAELLPYRAYDQQHDIYINTQSIGIVLEATPLVGATDKTVKTITSMVKHQLPENVSVQFINYASPKVGPVFDEWKAERQKTGGVYSNLAVNRLEYLKQYVWNSFFGTDEYPRGFVIRDFTLMVAISVPLKKDGTRPRAADIKMLASLRSVIESTMNSLSMNCLTVKPQRFIELIGELLNINKDIYNPYVAYNPDMAINKQIASPEAKIAVTPHHLLLHDDEFEVRSFSVRNYPQVWTQWSSSSLIGDFDENMLQIPCPFITMFSFTTINHDKSKTKASLKASRSAQQLGTGIARYMPELAEQAKDWGFVRMKMQSGERLVKAYYQVVAICPKGMADQIEAKIRELYSSQGWLLARDKYMHLQSFMTMLPMTLGEGLASDLDRLGRMKTMLSWTCANVMPLQGEWKGMNKPYLMLIGRRGQPMFWNPFQNQGGNYNVAVIGKSGAGKSVFMQDLVASMCGAGGRVVVIDDGHSFEHSCTLQGGTFVEFTSKNKLCLNPFSLVNLESIEKDHEYHTDVMILINQMVRQMCRATRPTDDIENAFIEKAIHAAWQEKRNGATITTVKDYLCQSGDKRAQDLGTMLLPFTSEGVFGKYFEGQANVRLDNYLVVFELSELKSRKHLQGIVMMLLMFVVTEEMYRDRGVNTTLLIDEAWDLLHGQATGQFIEGVARRARKYSGNLVTGTQSMNDYYKNPAATAAIENTDWYCLLAQNPESIEQLKKNNKLVMNAGTERMMKSLHVVQNRYSEVMIKGPGVEVVGRLILDPFSMALYSSTGKDFAQLEALLEQGFSIQDAVSQVAQTIKSGA